MKHLNDYEHGLYDATYRQIFAKNFVAGMARGLGGLVMQFIFLAIVYALFVQFLLPRISPFLETFEQATDQLEKLPDWQVPSFLDNSSTRTR